MADMIERIALYEEIQSLVTPALEPKEFAAMSLERLHQYLEETKALMDYPPPEEEEELEHLHTHPSHLSRIERLRSASESKGHTR